MYPNRYIKRSVAFFLFIGFQAISHAQVSPRWVSKFDGTGDYSDKINCLLPDGAGNFYLAGYTVKTGQNRDYMLLKTNSTGDTIWMRTYNGPGNGADEILAMALDNTGNIGVTGIQKGDGTSDDILTIKYSPDGTLLWVNVYNYLSNDDDQGNSIAFDANNNVLVTGQSDSDPSATSNDDYVTIKYNSAGQQQWVNHFNGTGNTTDRAVKVLTGQDGTVYITGRSANIDDDDYVTIKYSSTGTQIWKLLYDGGEGDDRATDMALDASGNAYITGRSDNGDDDDYITIKYSSAGTQQWVKQYDGTGAGNDRPTAICLGSDGSVLVTGQSDVAIGTAENDNFITIKYNGTGTQLWTASFSGAAGGEDIPSAICTDANGNVYVTGESFVMTSNNADVKGFASIKYNASGVTQWTKTFKSAVQKNDLPSDIWCDSEGNVFVTGHTQNQGSQKDAILLKYDSAGNQVWLKNYTGQGDNYDNVNAITTDASGNIVLGGYTVNTDTDRDLLILKYSPAGTLLWTWTYNGSSGFLDEITAIKTDANENIFACGFVKNSRVSYDFLTIKLNSSGQLVWAATYNSPYNESDKPWDIALDAIGNVYVTGESDGDVSGLSNDDFCTVKYNSTGQFQWVARYQGTGNATDRAVHVKTSSSGSVYVAGRSSNGTNDDFVLISYSSSGQVNWNQRFDGGFEDDHPIALALDPSGNIFVAGNSKRALDDDDCLLVKYQSNGNPEWSRYYNGSGTGNDRIRDISCDNNGNIIVVGETDSDASTEVKNYDVLVLKYNANGEIVWQNTYDGAAGTDDIAKSVVIDSEGSIFVSGQVENGSASNKNPDFISLKYNTNGVLQWYGSYNGAASGNDGANCMVLNQDRVCVAGSGWGQNSQRDIVLLNYLVTPNHIANNSITASFSIYPQPARQNLIVNGNGELIHSVALYKITGETVFESCFSATNSYELDVSQLQSGIYFLKINHQFTFKCILE